MDDRAKIAALCEALECACNYVEPGPGMGLMAYSSFMNSAEFLLKTCEEPPDEAVPVTDEESIDF
jgi:hypothetical protein